MKYALAAVFLFTIHMGFAQSAVRIDRSAFYSAIRQNKKQPIDKQLELLNSAPAEIREGFQGALLMRKAGLGGSPHQKIKLFREGHRELEAAIRKHPGNVEFRFLRLLIQENAPPALRYRDNLQEDSQIIENSYKMLPEEVQKQIADYSKKSKVLKLQVS